MSLGSKLRALRKSRSWSADFLGERAGVPQSAISDIEADKRSPRLSTLEKLAGGLGVPLVDLLPFEAHRDPEELTNDEKRLYALFHELSPDQRKLLIRVLEYLTNELSNDQRMILMHMLESMTKLPTENNLT